MATEMATESAPAAAETCRRPAAASGTKRWYVVHAYSGMEKAVERSSASASTARACSRSSADPGADRRSGRGQGRQESITERRFYPGYVLVEMDMTDEAWHLVKHTTKVTGFLGGSANRPSPISRRRSTKS